MKADGLHCLMILEKIIECHSILLPLPHCRCGTSLSICAKRMVEEYYVLGQDPTARPAYRRLALQVFNDCVATQYRCKWICDKEGDSR